MAGTRILTFTAIMAALSNIMSLPPLAIPIVLGVFSTSIHFSQIPIFLAGLLAGPWAGFFAGAVGGLYMSYSTGIPFIIGGLGLLGASTGFFARRYNLRPFFSSLFAWCIQAPYVVLTDYIWFVSTRLMPRSVAFGVITSIIVKLTIEALISSLLAEGIYSAVKRSGISIEG